MVKPSAFLCAEPKKQREMIQTYVVDQNELRTLIADTVNACLANWQQPDHREATPSGYITRQRVCDLLTISFPTLHRWMREGRVRPYHIGGRTLFKESEVLAAVEPVNYGVSAGKKKGGLK